jgi:pyruvate formate-lyase activating enzyme-like uncharacterized protein
VNLNELEFSERNYFAFHRLGYCIKNDISAAVKGSETTAKKIVTLIQKKDMAIGVHYCSVSFKDGVQLKNRITRRAKHIAKPYDVITKEGTLIKGIIYGSGVSFDHILSLLRETYKIPPHLFYVNIEKKRIELAAWVLEKIAPKLVKKGCRCFIVEEYPTADGLEVERDPVPAL